MVIIETVLGNINDREWAKRLSGASIDILELDQWEAQKNRFRKKTAKGTELAVALDRGTVMRDGDILVWEPSKAIGIAVRIRLREVMIVHLDGLAHLAPEIAMRTCLELGHALGNQHWPALIKGDHVYVPLTVDRKVMASVMKTHRFEDIRYEFVPGSEVVPYLAPHESRRLFGGAEGQVHSHVHETYAEIDAETGHVHSRSPIRPTRSHGHSGDHVHFHGSPVAPSQMTIQSDRAGGPRTAALLARMLQFGDSMFPIGSFSFSCGLESAIQKGIVVDTATLAAYARTAVEQAARGDGIALIAAHNAATAADFDALVQIDNVVFARKLSEETRTMTVRMGKKFTEIGLQVIDLPFLRRWCECIEAGTTPGCYPISLAINFAVQNLSAREAFVVHQYGVAAMILGASLRLMRISHVDTQGILYDLNARVDADFQIATKARLSDMAGYAPLTEILAAVHTKAHVRLFMS